MMETKRPPEKRIWKSYVWHEDKCWFVSTISRPFDTIDGYVSGHETLVWTYDWDKSERGSWVWQGGGVNDHQRVCRSLLASGEVPTDREDG